MKKEEASPGVEVISFDSMEEMEKYLEESQRQADENIHTLQRQITFGDYVIIPHDAVGIIWGHLCEFNEIVESEMESEYAEDPSYRKYVEEQIEKFATEDHRFYGEWYSTACPSGEFGSHHIVSMFPVTKEEFDTAREQEWCLTQKTAESLSLRISEAFGEME